MLEGKKCSAVRVVDLVSASVDRVSSFTGERDRRTNAVLLLTCSGSVSRALTKEATMATTVSGPSSAAPEGLTAGKTRDQRKESLGRAVERQISLGARVESRADYQAILITGRRPNRLVHAVTLGFAGAEHRMSVSVDESGNTSLQKLSR
jgi:hypothetical protein